MEKSRYKKNGASKKKQNTKKEKKISSHVLGLLALHDPDLFKFVSTTKIPEQVRIAQDIT